MEKRIYVSYPLGEDWYKLKTVSKKPKGENQTHFSLQQYYYWDNTWRFPSCAGRRFDEVNVSDKRPIADLMKGW